MAGLHALRGFDYQVTATLDLLIQRFKERPSDAVRPEGHDDVVFKDIHSGEVEFIQIKKPRENDLAQPTGESWSFNDVATELLPGTLVRLNGNGHRQRWVLGDDIDPACRNLLASGSDAPTHYPIEYTRLVHRLARHISNFPACVGPALSVSAKRKLERWEPDCRDVEELTSAYKAFAHSFAVPDDASAQYSAAVVTACAQLPSILSRTEVVTTYGREEEVRERVQRELRDRYGLSQALIRDNLVKVLRGFIQDVSTQPDKWFDATEFDFELRTAWPLMNMVASPPISEVTDVERRAVVEELLSKVEKGSFDVTGASGAGKTKVAGALVRAFAERCPNGHVFYLEVHKEDAVRDVLAGVAFSLRRFGINNVFEKVVDQSLSDEDVCRQAADALEQLDEPLLVVVDLVDGRCGDVFARELGVVVRRLSQSRIVVFGQESAFRFVGELERSHASIDATWDLPGLDFDEFSALVALHPLGKQYVLGWQQLREVFDGLSAGRHAGLLAIVADAAARADSFDAMMRLAKLKPDELLNERDRARYAELSAAARDAADRLLAFALPFDEQEAIDIFSKLRIREAVRELLGKGLLRRRPDGLLEMHEVVRAGLERLVPPAIQRESHSILSDYYRSRERSVESVHHLLAAGREAEANALALQEFREGRYRGALGTFVASKGLLSIDDFVGWIAENDVPKKFYELTPLARVCPDADLAARLIDFVERNGKRYEEDYQWAWWVTEMALSHSPSCLTRLVRFAVREDLSGKEFARLRHLVQAVRRQAAAIGPDFLALFSEQTENVRWILLPILLRDLRQEVLTVAFGHISKHGNNREYMRDIRSPGLGTVLNVSNYEEAISVLLAMPRIELSDIVVRRSVNYDVLNPLLWDARFPLTFAALKAVKDDGSSPEAKIAALRFLAFVGHPETIQIAERLSGSDDELGAIAQLFPSLLPEQASREEYRRRLFDAHTLPVSRIRWFTTLAFLGEPIGELAGTLIENEPEHTQLWEMLLVWNTAIVPCEEVVGIIERRLEEQPGDDVMAPIIASLAATPGERVTAFFRKNIDSHSPVIRLAAAKALLERRVPGMAHELSRRAQVEPDLNIRALCTVAALASHPETLNEVLVLGPDTENLATWRHIAAGRLRISSEAPSLALAATDRNLKWQSRRVALLALGRLDEPTAIEQAVSSVLEEGSPLAIDRHIYFAGHSCLSALLEEEMAGIIARMPKGRPYFVELFGDILNAWMEGDIWWNEVPSGTELAGWLFDRLTLAGCPSRPQAAFTVLDELHVPMLHAAALRVCRLAGRIDLIERQARRARSTWELARVLLELKKGLAPEQRDFDRLASIIASNPHSAHIGIQRILHEQTRQAPTVPAIGRVASTNESVSLPRTRLSYEQVLSVLESGDYPPDVPVLEGVGAAQAEHLARQLSPVRDPRLAGRLGPPSLHLTPKGFSLGGVGASGADRTASEGRRRLRAALVGSCRGTAKLDWHRAELLGQGVLGHRDSREHLRWVFEVFLATGATERLSEELEINWDVLAPHLDEIQWLEPVQALFSAECVPALMRLASVGTDSLLSSLCQIASWLAGPEVDPLLNRLFLRWYHRFERPGSYGQHQNNRDLWRAFNALVRHPRFERIPDYDLRLIELLPCKLAWCQRHDFLRILTRCPRAYHAIELQLMKAAPFMPVPYDEVERLDDAAQELFHAKVM